MSQILLAIASGKGVFGKSTFTAMLARTLINKGKKVGVLDFDFYGPSLTRLLPLDTPPQESGEWIIPGRSGPLEIVSIGSQGSFIRAPIANAFAKQLLKKVKWSAAEIVLIDLPPGTGDIHLTTFQEGTIKGVFVVTTPQLVSVDDVERSLRFFEKMEMPVLGVVENMADLFPGNGGEQLSKQWGMPLLGKIPFQKEMALACDSGSGFSCPDVERIADKIIAMDLESLERVHPTKIEKRDGGGVDLVWSDDIRQSIAACTLEKLCPCTLCKGAEKNTNACIGIDSIQLIGSFAMKFQFSKGCSHGIYSFGMIRGLN